MKLAFPVFTAEREAIEDRWLTAPPEPEAAFQEAGEARARWEAGLPRSADRRPWLVRRYWAKRDRKAGLPA